VRQTFLDLGDNDGFEYDIPDRPNLSYEKMCYERNQR